MAGTQLERNGEKEKELRNIQTMNQQNDCSVTMKDNIRVVYLCRQSSGMFVFSPTSSMTLANCCRVELITSSSPPRGKRCRQQQQQHGRTDYFSWGQYVVAATGEPDIRLMAGDKMLMASDIMLMTSVVRLMANVIKEFLMLHGLWLVLIGNCRLVW